MTYCDKSVLAPECLNAKCQKCTKPERLESRADYEKSQQEKANLEKMSPTNTTTWEENDELITVKKGSLYKFILNEHKLAQEETKAICKKIFMEEVDWAEWGGTDEEAGENFEEYYQKVVSDKE